MSPTKSVSFAFDLKVLVPDYEVDGRLFLKRHFEGGYIYRELVLVETFPDGQALGSWKVKYGYQDINPGKPGVSVDTRKLATGDGQAPESLSTYRSAKGEAWSARQASN